MRDDDFNTFLDAYTACALWSSTDESDERGGKPMDDNYDESDIADETRIAMHEDCSCFVDHAEALGLLKGADPSQAGHDFWLTRNGHGAGFWDRSPETYPADPEGKELSALAKTYGSVDLIVGDDGRIH